MLSSANIRQSLGGLLRTLAGPRLSIPLILAFLYVGAIIAGLRAVHLWSPALLKDTAFWFFAALASAGSLITANEPVSPLRHFTKGTITGAIILEFLLGSYTLPLWAELLLVPLLVLIYGMLAVAKPTDPQHQRVRQVLEWLIAGIGLTAGAFALRAALLDLPQLFSAQTLQTLLLPAALSLLFVPFAYGLRLWSTYEQTLLLLRFDPTKSGHFKRYARRRLLQRFGLRLAPLQRFYHENRRYFFQIRSKAALEALLRGQVPALGE